MSGTIYALVYLTNNTVTDIRLNGSTPDAWGTWGDTPQRFPGYVTMPDGSPPPKLPCWQTAVFGTKSDGGFLATSGAGGSLSIPLQGDQTASISWSVPWSYYNGLWGNAVGVSSMANPQTPPLQPFTINGGCVGCAGQEETPSQECEFVFTLAGGPVNPPAVCSLLTPRPVALAPSLVAVLL